jgi:cytochrome c-type biogenesis protein CcmF
MLALSLFGLAANGQTFLFLLKTKPTLSGGSFAHIGLALTLIGILYSAGYSKVISLNTTGKVYRSDFSTEMNQENVLMWRHTPIKMGPYSLWYKGPRLELKNGLGYLNKELLVQTDHPDKGILTDSVKIKGQWKKPGDTLAFFGENTYYEIEYQDTTGAKFTLFPRAQVNPNMGLIASPDILKTVTKDLYTHVTSIPSPDEEIKYSEPVGNTVHLGDTFFVGDQVAILEKVQKVSDYLAASIGPSDAAIEAKVRILGSEQSYFAKPVFVIRNQQIGMIPDVVEDVGARITLTKIDPTEKTFTLVSETTRKDWIILKAVEKPGINILWAGVLVMSTGFGISVRRRLKESRN